MRCLLFLLLLLPPGGRLVQAAPWWTTGVVYQVYPRSFQDGCGAPGGCDGVGDLVGVMQRLPYLKALGVTALWLSPIYVSPMADGGYDISNYTAIAPVYGDLAAFDALLEAAHRQGLKLILDFVPNHSSQEHPWFIDSRASRASPRRDWYVWREGAAPGQPPNNWRSLFCLDHNCSAWTLDQRTGMWYYHQFLPQQPDLNWRNPQVVEAMIATMRFWLDRGVDGFRIDAFAYLLEDPNFDDEPEDPDWHGDPLADGYNRLHHTHTENQPGLHELLGQLRRAVDSFAGDRVLIGEIYADRVVTAKDVMSFYGTSARSPELSMPFNMALVGFFDEAGGLKTAARAAALRTLVDAYEAALPHWAQPNYVLGNHDVPRVGSRLAASGLDRVAQTLLLTLRGTPTLYNGDEFGQRDGVVSPSQYRDPNCAAAATGQQCRDPERTPLQWTGDLPNAGFTSQNATPWLPISPDAAYINVAAAETDPGSMLNLTRRLLALRQAEPCLHLGDYQAVDNPSPAAVFTFVRTCNRDSFFLVLVNFAAEATVLDMTRWVAGERVTVAVDTRMPAFDGAAVDLRAVHLQARQALVLRTFHQSKGNNDGTGKSSGSHTQAVVGTVCAITVVSLLTVVVLVARASRRGVTRLSVSADATGGEPLTQEEEDEILLRDSDGSDEEEGGLTGRVAHSAVLATEDDDMVSA